MNIKGHILVMEMCNKCVHFFVQPCSQAEQPTTQAIQGYRDIQEYIRSYNRQIGKTYFSPYGSWEALDRLKILVRASLVILVVGKPFLRTFSFQFIFYSCSKKSQNKITNCRICRIFCPLILGPPQTDASRRVIAERFMIVES